MIILTNPNVQPNATRVQVVAVKFNDRTSTGSVVVALKSSNAGNREILFSLGVANGSCQRLRVNPAPEGWNDIVMIDSVEVPTGYDFLESAYSGANRAARLRAIETALLSMGVIDVSLTGTVQ